MTKACLRQAGSEEKSRVRRGGGANAAAIGFCCCDGGAGLAAREFLWCFIFFESCATLTCRSRERSCTSGQTWDRTSTHWPK